MNGPAAHVIGVDGGATRTRVLLADYQGRTLAQSEGGPGLMGVGEDETVIRRIVEQATDLSTQLGVLLPVETLCAGLAGVAERPEARDLMVLRISEATVARRVLIVSDHEVAFDDAFGQGDGILIIAGTGSVAAGRSGSGALIRVGGWGPLIGDEGSGYRLGLEGVRAAVRAADGREPRTALTEGVLTLLGVESARQAFEWSRGVAKADIAALAPRVIEVADSGDGVARDIVSRGVESLVRHAEALARDISFKEPPPIALAGGLIEPGGGLRDRVVRALEERGFRVSPEPVIPGRGAIQLALRARIEGAADG